MTKHNNHRRATAFTLVELLVVVALMGILSGILSYTMAGARQDAREKRARAEIEAMSAILLQKLQEIYLLPVAFTPPSPSGTASSAAGDEVRNGEEHNRTIMLARRDLARMALPQCRADLMYPPARIQYRRRANTGGNLAFAQSVKAREPAEWGDMRRLARFSFPNGAAIEKPIAVTNRVFAIASQDPLYGGNGYFSSSDLRDQIGAISDNSGNTQFIDLSTQNDDWNTGSLSDETNIPWTREYESAECLYLILATTFINGERAIDQFSSRMIANLDGDAVPEIVDPWGVPYEFIRDATGFEAPYDTAIHASHPAGADGNDFLRTDFRYRRLTATDPLDDPYRIVPLIISAGIDGEFGIRRTFNKGGSIADGTAGISPAASISAVRLANGAGANLPTPIASSGAYQYPDPYISFLPTEDVTAAVSLGNLSSMTLRTWSGQGLGLGAVIDKSKATDNILSTRLMELDK